MFESGNFKRRKRMRRHTYKPGLYKGWLGESQAFQSLYRNYPGSLYMAGAPWALCLMLRQRLVDMGTGHRPLLLCHHTPTPCSHPCHKYRPSPHRSTRPITSTVECHSLEVLALRQHPSLHSLPAASDWTTQQ